MRQREKRRREWDKSRADREMQRKEIDLGVLCYRSFCRENQQHLEEKGTENLSWEFEGRKDGKKEWMEP